MFEAPSMATVGLTPKYKVDTPKVPISAANSNAWIGVTSPLTTGLAWVLTICLSNSGSLPIFMAFAEPAHNVVPTVRHSSSLTEAGYGDRA